MVINYIKRSQLLVSSLVPGLPQCLPRQMSTIQAMSAAIEAVNAGEEYEAQSCHRDCHRSSEYFDCIVLYINMIFAILWTSVVQK